MTAAIRTPLSYEDAVGLVHPICHAQVVPTCFCADAAKVVMEAEQASREQERERERGAQLVEDLAALGKDPDLLQLLHAVAAIIRDPEAVPEPRPDAAVERAEQEESERQAQDAEEERS